MIAAYGRPLCSLDGSILVIGAPIERINVETDIAICKSALLLKDPSQALLNCVLCHANL